MADTPSIEDSDIPQLAFIPEQFLASGTKVEIPFYEFATVQEGAAFEFSISDFPPGLSIDPKTGIVTGIAPTTELNQTYVASLTLTNLATGKYAQAIFRMEIIGSILLETPEGRAYFTNEKMSFWDSVKSWELQLFIQQLIREHFTWVMIYDAAQHLGTLGAFQNRRVANSGWEIINFENAVMITPGNKAFEQYGNRRRVLDTLREAYRTDVSAKAWKNVLLDGSDLESIGKAWIIGKELNIPVNEIAPSDVAEINFYNLNRIYAGNTPSKRTPQPGG